MGLFAINYSGVWASYEKTNTAYLFYGIPFASSKLFYSLGNRFFLNGKFGRPHKEQWQDPFIFPENWDVHVLRVAVAQ